MPRDCNITGQAGQISERAMCRSRWTETARRGQQVQEMDLRSVHPGGPRLARARAHAFDDPLGQHEGWTGEFGVWKEQAFALDHRVISIAHLGGARQAIDGFALNPEHVYNM
jgi:hypothetical protein